MRILGIDYGDARTGLSISDETGMLAGSPSVIAEWNRDRLLQRLTEYIRAERIGEVVLGYPKNMDGTIGERAKLCEALAHDLEQAAGVPVVLWDERRTTVAAQAILHASGKKARKQKRTVDAVAATLILQGYLDWRRQQP